MRGCRGVKGGMGIGFILDDSWGAVGEVVGQCCWASNPPSRWGALLGVGGRGAEGGGQVEVGVSVWKCLFAMTAWVRRVGG